MTSFAELNHPLGLRSLPLSYAEFTKLAYESFADESTLVFLDTNVLGLPFRFHSEARKGFFSMLNIALSQKRLYVPAWASNEFFHNAFKSSAKNGHGLAGSAELVSKLPSRDKVLGLLGKVASDADLDRVAKALGVKKPEALNEIADIAVAWNEAVAKIGADLNPEIIHEEVNHEFKNCFLPLDYNRHCAEVHQHADRRRANRIPPGLTDAHKGDTEKRGRNAGNVDGDLALWLEILDNAEQLLQAGDGAENSSRPFSCVLVLTEEKKEDFSYAPRTRAVDTAANKKITVQNVTPRVLLTDPRLVSEFESRMKHRNVAFVSIETLAHGWQSVKGNAPGGDDIKAFSRALMQQVETENAKEADSLAEGKVPGTEPEAATAEQDGTPAKVEAGQSHPAGDDRLNVPEAAANDEKSFIDGLAALPGVDMIHALNTHNWYVQNPAVQQLLLQGVPNDIGIAFVLGRSLYQAAHGNAWRADIYIKKFAETAAGTRDAEQALLAGLVYEALFDGSGSRRREPKSRNLHYVLGLLCMDQWKKARDWIVTKMHNSMTHYYWKPCEPFPELSLTIKGTSKETVFEVHEAVISSPGFTDVQLLKKREGNESEAGCLNAEELLDWVADCTLVPLEQIKLLPKGINKLEFKSDLTLNPIAIYRVRRVD